MPCHLHAGVAPGQIFRHLRYYRTGEGEWKRKYLLVLAGSPGGDVIYRLLTSRAYGRPKSPRCFHGLPYPGFYLGLLGGPLTTDSWLSLQQADDYDGLAFLAGLRDGVIEPVVALSVRLLCPALDCAANAEDTTRQQEGCIRDVRAGLGCP
jgi:hypothetical protein